MPGERGIMVPLAEDAVTAEVGAAADYIPEGMARAAAPELPELAQYQVLRHYLRYSQMTLGMDLGSDISEGTCTMKYSPKLHEELIRGHRAADVHPWQDEDTMQGLLEIVYETGQYLKSISGMDAFTLQPGGGSHAVFTNACVMRRYFEARGELGPAQRDDHDDLLAPVRRGHADGGRLQGHHRDARRERLPGPRGLPRRGQREDRRLHDHQPRGHRHLQPADRQVRRDPARGRRPGVHRPGQRQRHPRHRAGARRRLRRLPLQPAQDLLQPARLRGPGHRRLPVLRELAPYLPVPLVAKDGDRYPPRLRPAGEHRPRARLPRQLDGRHPRLRLDPQPGPRGPQGGRRDLRAQQQLPRQPAHGRSRA